MPIKTKISKLLPYSLKSSILETAGYLNFKKCLLLNKPYFGHYLSAGQTWTQRREVMRKLLEKELSKSKSEDYKVLEVGSWGGQSAVLWASVCKEFSKGRVFCVDTWMASINSPDIMKNATKKDKIMKLFLHNIYSSGLKKYINPIRGTSDEISKVLKPKTFDFVYIDGDHAYSQFKRDLINYSKFCKIGEIVCGDDLELLPSEVDLENARNHKEEDYIEDPKTGKAFHPGITLAVKEFFKEVGMLNGFWAVRKTGRGWKKIMFE